MSMLPLLIEKAADFHEADHPRGDDGRFIGDGELDEARADPSKVATLRARVTDPAERRKLDAHLRGQGGTPAHPKPFHDWSDYRPPGRFGGETDEEFTEWKKAADAHDGKVKATVAHWIENGLEWEAPAEVRGAYADSLHRVFTNLGQHMTAAAMKATRYVRFHQSPEVMTRLFAEGTQLKEGQAIGGVWQQDQKGGRGTLNIDGGFKGGPAMPELHAHEIGHAIDSDGRYSRKVAWRNAWKEEIDRDGAPLSEYARTHPEEGFAEYIRLVASGKTDFVNFKKCHQFLKSEGLL